VATRCDKRAYVLHGTVTVAAIRLWTSSMIRRTEPDGEALKNQWSGSVRFAARIPVRPVRLIAEGCGLSRAEVDRLITEGKLVSAVRLNGKLSGDFTFTLKR
jgi:hypothetical protein